MLYKRQLVLHSTITGIRVKQKEMEQFIFGRKKTFFLLVLAVSASAKSLNTAITATSDRQVRSVHVSDSMTTDALNVRPYNTHTTTLSLSTEKGRTVLPFEGLHIQQCWGNVEGRGRGTG